MQRLTNTCFLGSMRYRYRKRNLPVSIYRLIYRLMSKQENSLGTLERWPFQAKCYSIVTGRYFMTIQFVFMYCIIQLQQLILILCGKGRATHVLLQPCNNNASNNTTCLYCSNTQRQQKQGKRLWKIYVYIYLTTSPYSLIIITHPRDFSAL